MDVRDPKILLKASKILRKLYGRKAQFREGQYEAIEATLLHHRTLVVQRTGWGKSLVYFICTRILRDQGEGVTLVVSPLLVLMENQMQAAKKLGLRCESMNSQTRDRREEILRSILEDRVDLVFITPETLFSEDVQSCLQHLRIGLFVIDECHCISDWGHDFRLEYSRLREVLATLPAGVPVRATTATANDRVIADLKRQLGEQVYISRGPLTRESLSIQVLHMPSKAERYAWILENLPKLPGSGIIYCLTRRDCDYLADFLQKNGVSAMAYYSRDGEDEEQNHTAERAFQKNKIKAIVATVKLGMGYDKGDIAFVIHFQMPANIVSYYQQIGRAGRSIDNAYVFLMSGEEDVEILRYFIETAFPKREETLDIIDSIRMHEGMSLAELAAALNIRRSRIEKALLFLQKDGCIYKKDATYYLSPKPFQYNEDHYRAVTESRYWEMAQMGGLTATRGCYSQYIVNALDDSTAEPCGRCANCLGHPLLPEQVGAEALEKASAYINDSVLTIEPRRHWAVSEVTGGGALPFVNQEGICLSRYGDPGYGQLVSRDKYSAKRRFCDELVGRSAQILLPLIKENQIQAITCVPSLRSDLVRDFAERLAVRCRLPFAELLEKSGAAQQKHMENSAHQCANAFRSFSIRKGVKVPKRVLLVDDVVDSRWTLTICGIRLMENGCEAVWPFALADSSRKAGT